MFIISPTSVKAGFIDYNDTTGEINLLADTWTDVPNNGAGPFSNSLFPPPGVTQLIDTNTGYLDFSQLALGAQLLIRTEFKVIPDTNNSLVEVRYLLGQGAGEYPLQFLSQRLDSGSGKPYPFTPSFPIYMGDLNTQGGVGKLQIKLSTTGKFINSGSYIKVTI